ncbi:kallikrein-8-like [Cloeon dipterum]|uniref:kallikrein-8-like n=1 Tax=Cloeon dipterum TaxID=197152 RepID=UPI0032204A94
MIMAKQNSWHPVLPYYLKKAEVRIVSKDKCNELYMAKFHVTIFKNNICAGGEGKDTCNGDSGGPLVKDGVLHGVVSWGPSECGLMPGVYTEVASFANWINSVITSDNE